MQMSMKYSPRMKAAIRFSIKTHEVYQKQKRKGKDVAYITHPLTVGLILSQARASEEAIIAGILHDTIEDSPKHKKVTVQMLRERFGARVAFLVDSVTEHRKSDPWTKRKREALQHIATFSHGSVLVKSADVLANARELIDDVTRYGDAVFSRFHGTKEHIVANYLAVITALLRRRPRSPLVGDLKRLRSDLKSIARPH